MESLSGKNNLFEHMTVSFAGGKPVPVSFLSTERIILVNPSDLNINAPIVAPLVIKFGAFEMKGQAKFAGRDVGRMTLDIPQNHDRLFVFLRDIIKHYHLGRTVREVDPKMFNDFFSTDHTHYFRGEGPSEISIGETGAGLKDRLEISIGHLHVEIFGEKHRVLSSTSGRLVGHLNIKEVNETTEWLVMALATFSGALDTESQPKLSAHLGSLLKICG